MNTSVLKDEVEALKEIVRETYKAARFSRDAIGSRTGKDGNPSLVWVRLNFICRMIEEYSRVTAEKKSLERNE